MWPSRVPSMVLSFLGTQKSWPNVLFGTHFVCILEKTIFWSRGALIISRFRICNFLMSKSTTATVDNACSMKPPHPRIAGICTIHMVTVEVAKHLHWIRAMTHATVQHKWETFLSPRTPQLTLDILSSISRTTRLLESQTITMQWGTGTLTMGISVATQSYLRTLRCRRTLLLMQDEVGTRMPVVNIIGVDMMPRA